MRRFILPTICLLFIFSACKKKTDIAPANTISATVDGVNMNFNTNIVAHFVNNQQTAGTSSLIIEGVTAAQTPSSGIGISLLQPMQTILPKVLIPPPAIKTRLLSGYR